MPGPTATWNSARGAWEVPEIPSLFELCEHSELYSGIFPTSGSMRSGQLFPHQQSELPTSASGSSSSRSRPSPSGLLPTPTATDGNGGRNKTANRTPGSQHHDGTTLCDAIRLLPTSRASNPAPAVLLPTPRARDWKRGGKDGLEEALLPTPTAVPYGNNQSPTPGAAVRPSLESLARSSRPSPGALGATPRATDGTNGGPNQRGSSGDLMLPSAVMQLLPTPRASANENRQTTRTPSQEAGTHGLNLSTEACLIEREREYVPVIKLLPTPRTTDANGAGTHGDGGQDLRTAIRTLTSTGDRTPRPSDDGRP